MVKPIVINDSSSDNDTQRCTSQTGTGNNTSYQTTPTKAVNLQQEKQKSPRHDSTLSNIDIVNRNTTTKRSHTRTTEHETDETKI